MAALKQVRVELELGHMYNKYVKTASAIRREHLQKFSHVIRLLHHAKTFVADSERKKNRLSNALEIFPSQSTGQTTIGEMEP